MALDQHFESHSEPKEVVDSLAVDDDKNMEDLKRAKIELDLTTHNAHHSDCMISMMVPFKVTHASGATSLALLTQTAAKRAFSDPIMRLDPIKRPRPLIKIEATDIEVLLSTSRHGAIIKLTDYKPLEPAFFLKEYKQFKSEIAQKLAGAIIHTGSQVVLILKAEVYGRAPADDPHSFDLVKPILDVKRVSKIFHDNVEKLIIGTQQWSSLITSSLELTSGTIDAGANNTYTLTASQSTIWGRDDWQLNPLVERQLRSKFYHKETYSRSASVFRPISNWACIPVTIFSLNNYYQRNVAMTGIKAASVVFKNIISSRKRVIKRKVLEQLLDNRDIKKAPLTETLLLGLLQLSSPNEKNIQLIDNYDCSILLSKLAETLCGTITLKNNNHVKPNIQAVIDKILHASSSNQDMNPV
ncbi:hypothetical protein EC968_009548 [Mortierella alpina]|nr:hypothetical protein EC968_009548 [Mortierella alpina]